MQVYPKKSMFGRFAGMLRILFEQLLIGPGVTLLRS